MSFARAIRVWSAKARNVSPRRLRRRCSVRGPTAISAARRASDTSLECRIAALTRSRSRSRNGSRRRWSARVAPAWSRHQAAEDRVGPGNPAGPAPPGRRRSPWTRRRRRATRRRCGGARRYRRARHARSAPRRGRAAWRPPRGRRRARRTALCSLSCPVDPPGALGPRAIRRDRSPCGGTAARHRPRATRSADIGRIESAVAEGGAVGEDVAQGPVHARRRAFPDVQAEGGVAGQRGGALIERAQGGKGDTGIRSGLGFRNARRGKQPRSRNAQIFGRGENFLGGLERQADGGRRHRRGLCCVASGKSMAGGVTAWRLPATCGGLRLALGPGHRRPGRTISIE